MEGRHVLALLIYPSHCASVAFAGTAWNPGLSSSKINPARGSLAKNSLVNLAIATWTSRSKSTRKKFGLILGYAVGEAELMCTLPREKGMRGQKDATRRGEGPRPMESEDSRMTSASGVSCFSKLYCKWKIVSSDSALTAEFPFSAFAAATAFAQVAIEEVDGKAIDISERVL